MARARGIEVIVDGAHAFAHFPFTHADLDCDYYGTSLHKWLFAPHGTGFLYVRKSKIKDALAADGRARRRWTTNIRKFEEIGTHPAANHNGDRRGADVPRGHRRSSARPRACATSATAGRSASPARRACKHPHELRSGDVLRHRERRDRGRRHGEARTAPVGQAPDHRRRPSCTTNSRACASPRTSTRRSTRSTSSPRRWRR